MNGDEDSFKQLMKLHVEPLFNYGTKYTEDTELVKDCIQELFVHIWDRKDRLSTEVNPRAYLMASLRRILHRKLQAEERFVRYVHESSEDYFDFEVSVEQKIINNESTQLLIKKLSGVISTLPKRQKEVIYLKFFQNLSRDEIAEIMDNTPQTVSNLIQMALKRLRLDVTSLLFLLLFSCGL